MLQQVPRLIGKINNSKLRNASDHMYHIWSIIKQSRTLANFEISHLCLNTSMEYDSRSNRIYDYSMKSNKKSNFTSIHFEIIR